MTTALVFGLIAVGLFLTLPMFVVLTGVAFIVFALTTPIPLSILPQRVFAGIQSFPLMSIPFFVLAASIMGKGGLSARLVVFIESFVGHLPGGLGVTVVLTCLLFASITGSSASTIVAVGGILYPALIAAGYTERFSIGVITCSALIGMIIPPSNAMIVFGAVAGVSIGALFMAGIGAGMVFAVLYAAYCVLWSIANRVPRRPRLGFRERWIAARQVVWGLGMPVIILGGIYGGVFTPTEAAAVSVVYSAFVCVVVYRELDLQGLWDVCIEAAEISARVLIMVGAASLLSWLMTVSGITQAIVEPFMGLRESPWTVLLLANGLFLITGMFIDVFSNILILVPILLGTIAAAGINNAHFGIVTAVNTDIGNITPPFGFNLFVASGTFDKPYLTVVRAVLPWLAIAILSLAIVTFLPEVSLWLPKRLYPEIG